MKMEETRGMSDFEAKVYEAYKTEVKLIAKAEDVSIQFAVDMFISNIERGGTYKYVNEEEAKAKFAEIRAELAQ